MKQLKFAKLIAPIIVSGSLFCSCGSDDKEQNTLSLRYTAAETTFTYNDNKTLAVTVETNSKQQFVPTVAETWVELSDITATTFKVGVKEWENSIGQSARTATVKVKVGDAKEQTLTITQTPEEAPVVYAPDFTKKWRLEASGYKAVARDVFEPISITQEIEFAYESYKVTIMDDQVDQGPYLLLKGIEIGESFSFSTWEGPRFLAFNYDPETYEISFSNTVSLYSSSYGECHVTGIACINEEGVFEQRFLSSGGNWYGYGKIPMIWNDTFSQLTFDNDAAVAVVTQGILNGEDFPSAIGFSEVMYIDSINPPPFRCCFTEFKVTLID